MQFNLQPNLKGKLVELRPLRADDYCDLYAVAADPRIWEQHPNKDRYKEDVFRSFFDEALESNGTLVAIDLRSERLPAAIEKLNFSRAFSVNPHQAKSPSGSPGRPPIPEAMRRRWRHL